MNLPQLKNLIKEIVLKKNIHIIITVINTDSEHNSSEEQPQKRPVGKPRTAIWRSQRDDGKYNKNPISPTYYNDYYREKMSIKVQCPYCEKLVVKQTLGRHINTVQKCLIIQNKNI